MPLAVGRRLGPYEVTGLLGAGGMGEVYRARDSKLQRDVAIKVLPEALAHDTERLARFEREARTLASLNHPQIAQIYGLEESDGISALVMELVEGPTLADRIAGRPLPMDEALPIARQIAEALEAAHEQGIIHRDLKPANIKVRPDGAVKVLDFGLAKLALPEVAAGRADVTASPTITSPAMITGVGVLLGTAVYMSPEQAKGREADKRSDVWAFGCVVYEMLTGRRAFDGDDMTDVLGAVVRLEPRWEAIPSEVPPAIRTLLQHCLVKDRRKRIGDVAAARFVLDQQADIEASSTAPPPARPLWHRATTMAAALAIGALLAGASVWLLTRPDPPSVVRTTIAASASTALALFGSDRDVAITPDGARVVYRGRDQILVRALNQLEPTVLTGLGAPRGLFVSPDGQWIGFFDGQNLLKKVRITGGPPMLIASVDGGGPRGAAWGPDGTIVFGTNIPTTGLQRVSEEGGQPTVLTTPDHERGEGDHLWPEFLPEGKAVLFTIMPAGRILDNAEIWVLDLQTGRSKLLVRGGSHATYVPTGHLVYAKAGTLRAVAFDLGRLEVIGTPAPVLEDVVTTVEGAADAAMAADGSLVYVSGGAGLDDRRTVVWVDRQGRASPLPGISPNSYRDVRISRDGARLALQAEGDVWTYDFARATLGRLTTDPARDGSPLWTPDGQRIVFTSDRAGYAELFWRSADGTGRDERLVTRSKDLLNLRANSWSKDGTRLLFMEAQSDSQAAIAQVAIARPSDVEVLVKSESRSNDAAVSPDGRWMAYETRVNNRSEIDVVQYPELGNRQRISSGGGQRPTWSRDGRELFFGSLDGRQMLAVAVQSGTRLVAGRQRVLFDFAMLPIVGSSRSYDVAPDGRFVIIPAAAADTAVGTGPSLVFVQHWFEELKRLVPTK